MKWEKEKNMKVEKSPLLDLWPYCNVSKAQPNRQRAVVIFPR